jgi:methionine sulfoxide reductase heme-binding subunit
VKTYWYLTRASGAVALILLTLTIVIGVAAVSRAQSRRWPRFAVDAQHRSASLLAFVFLIVHIATAVLDSFAPISLPDAIIPFFGVYRPLWLGLGATAFDVLLAVAVTSLVRERLGHRTWRAVHWLVYAAWPIAVLHGLGTGSDIRQGWMTVVYLVCGAAVAAAVIVRIVAGWPQDMAWRLGGVGMVAGFALALAVWLPSGPLAAGWARRAGTPTQLLHSPARAQTAP